MPKKEATAIKTIAVTINKSAVVSMFLTSFSGTAENQGASIALTIPGELRSRVGGAGRLGMTNCRPNPRPLLIFRSSNQSADWMEMKKPLILGITR